MTDNEHHDIADTVLSFVVPVFNGAEALAEFYSKFRQVADKLGQSYEIIFIDDGSTDESPEIIQAFVEDDDSVRCISFSRTFGTAAAITAGYDYAAGLAVISLDADGQRQPELIPELVAQWRRGYEVVCAVNTNTEESRPVAKCIVGLARRLTGMDPADESDFRLLDRKVVDVLRRARERSRFIRGLVHWAGFGRTEVQYDLAPTQDDTPARPFDFSVKPLRIIGMTGAVMMGAAVLYTVIALILWPFLGGAILANLVMLVVGLTGMQLAAIGICGEYVGRIYDETRKRPIYIVRQAVGFESDAEEIQPQLQPTRSVASIEPSKIRLFT